MNLAENQGFIVWFLTLTVLICYTWRSHWDVSWMLNYWRHKIVQILVQILKISPNFKIRVYFWFMGWAGFWVCTGFFPVLTQKWHQLHHHIHHHQPSCELTTSSVCAIRVSRVREWCVIIGLPVPWVCLLCQQCAIMPEGCFLEVPEVLDVLKAKSLCHCARWLKTHKTVLMAQSYL